MQRLTYTPNQLLSLKNNCVGLARRTKRYLFFLGIDNKSHSCVPSKRIPVRVTRRSLATTNDDSEERVSRRKSNLRRITFQNVPRRSRSRLPTIFFSNVRSIFNKIDEVSLALHQHKVDIGIFVESWLHDQLPDTSVAIDGFHILRRDRLRGPGGGIMCYYASWLFPTMITSTNVPAIGKCETEFMPVFFREISFLLIVCYHPFWNNVEQHELAIDCITDIMDYVAVHESYNSSLRVMLVGDFNDLCKFYDTISSLTDLKSCVSFATRGDKTLDQVFSNCDFEYLPPQKLAPLGRSDHCSILLCPIVCQQASYKRKVRSFSKSAVAGFREAVCATDWDVFWSEDAPLDDVVEAFLTHILYLYDVFFKIKTIRLRAIEPPWMKNSLKVLINERDRAFLSSNRCKFLRLREEVIRHTKYLKADYLKKAVSSGNVKNLWCAFRTLTNQSKKSVTNCLTPQNFSDFFATTVHDPDDIDVMSCFPDIGDLPDVNLNVSCQDVENHFRKLKKTSCGPDGIPPWVFRSCRMSLSPFIAAVFNRSLIEGYVPKCFKQAYIIPVPKCANATSVSDHRPISMLPTLSKILEKIICEKYVVPAIEHQVNANQFAYVPGPGKGSVVALAMLYLRILRHLDTKSGAVRVATIDLSKAFDSLTHESIIESCIRFNLPKLTVIWIMSYLSGRSQRVLLNGNLSNHVTVTRGVPQGSVIGPLLFSLVVDSLTPSCDNSCFVKYADDLTILHFIRNSADDRLQHEIDRVKDWTDSHHLSINERKCCVMDVVTKKSISCASISLFGSEIKSVSSINILGCVLSDDLKWNAYVESIVKRASRRIFLILSLKRADCSSELLLKAYNAYIRPILLYAFPAVCNMSTYLKRKIERVEKRVLRVIGGNKEVTLFSVANKMCDNLFKNVLEEPNHPLREFFNENPATSRTLRKNCVLRRPLTKTARYKDSFIKFCP